MNIVMILLAVAFVLLNAFFVAAEFAMVKLRHTRVQAISASYGLRGRILQQVHRHLDAYLSACQLGITLASLALGWIGEPAFAHLLQGLFHALHIVSSELVTTIAFLCAFLFISFLHIVIGELMPKSLAMRQSEAVSIWTAIPLYGFYWLMYPIIWVLNICSNFFLRAMGLDATHPGEKFYSSDEIKLILNASHIHGELTQDETDILEHTLDLADLNVTEVMRPDEEMIALNIHEPIDQLMAMVITHRYSRYPVYDPALNQYVGILHVKDLFAAVYHEKEITNLQAIMRPILTVSYRLPALDLLHKFREGMSHFALVFKGKDNLIGFVTLDNLLHVLIGRTTDEFHKTQDDWYLNADGSLTVKGTCSIYALERALDKDITLTQEEAELDTLAGLIVMRAGGLPKKGDRIHFIEFDVVIDEVQGSYVRRLTLYPKGAVTKF